MGPSAAPGGGVLSADSFPCPLYLISIQFIQQLYCWPGDGHCAKGNSSKKDTPRLGEDDIKYHHRASYLLPQASAFIVFKMGKWGQTPHGGSCGV